MSAVTSEEADYEGQIAGNPARQWRTYRVGDYEKKWYDIKTMAGHTYYSCWPNAGSFNIGNGETVDEHFVLKIRISRLDDLGLPQRKQS